MNGIGDVVALVYNCLPDSVNIEDPDIESDPRAFYFKWKGTAFRVGLDLDTYEVQEGMNRRNPATIAMCELFRTKHNLRGIINETRRYEEPRTV